MHGLRTFCVIFCLQMSYCPPNMDRDNNEPPVKKCQKKRPPCGKCCSVWGCNNSRRKDRLGVFSFPKPEHEPERHAEWVRVVRQTRADFRYHPSSSFICADHFPEESISNLTKIRLLSARNPHDNTPWKLVPGAVPIISKLPPRPRLGSTISPAKPKAQSTPTKLTRRRLAAVKRERRRHMDAALHAEAEKMVPPAPAEPDELGEPSNGPDHPDYIFLKVEDNLEGNLESNHKEPVSESTMSNKKLIETVDGLVIKEESDNIFVADNDMMEKVKEEREDEMIVWKIEDDVTFKEESLDMDMEDDSHPYEDCEEDPLLTLKCKSCEEVCATRSDLETHTKDKHGSGEHPRGQKRKKLVKSKHDKLYDHGKSSCDKIASRHSSCYSSSDSAAEDNLVVPSTSAVPTALSHRFDDFDPSSDEWEEVEYFPKRRSRIISSSSDDGSDSELEARMQERHASEQPMFVWQRKTNVPKRFRFCARPVVNVRDLHQGSTPFEIYSHFITPELMDCLVQETNRYYHQQPAPPSSDKTEWHNTSREELHAYFGLWLLMDYHPSSDIETYWQDPIFYQPMFPKTMSLDRFIQLTQNLHVVDNSATHPGDDCLWKFRPLLNMLNQQFSSVYTPPQKITVDSQWRLKDQFGLKMYKLCVSDGMTSGYTIALSIYSGDNKRKLPSRMRAIVELMAAADLFGKGYELYTNSKYTSPSLFQYLQSQHTNAIGTVYTIRKYMPIDLQTTAYGDVDLRSTPTGILCLQWHNKGEPITMLSTVHSGIVTNTPQSKKKHIKPKVVSDYTAATKGEDMRNQFLLSYQTARKSIKWYKKVILYLFDIAVVNSFCVHQALGGKLSQFDFQVRLIRDLLKESTAIRRGSSQRNNHLTTVPLMRRL
ncbi:uncharacterized protein LOC134772780 [Penaeus indicus]|uniref:uncharacterized protein LOC134772780 n=1 Tax=Penaeus indicus TaxID=29960 RepID=UPI00300C01D4